MSPHAKDDPVKEREYREGILDIVRKVIKHRIKFGNKRPVLFVGIHKRLDDIKYRSPFFSTVEKGSTRPIGYEVMLCLDKTGTAQDNIKVDASATPALSDDFLDVTFTNWKKPTVASVTYTFKAFAVCRVHCIDGRDGGKFTSVAGTGFRCMVVDAVGKIYELTIWSLTDDQLLAQLPKVGTLLHVQGHGWPEQEGSPDHALLPGPVQIVTWPRVQFHLSDYANAKGEPAFPRIQELERALLSVIPKVITSTYQAPANTMDVDDE
jgi:hypothetical protein